MPRGKSTRKLSYKPLSRAFVPENDDPNGVVVLQHDEIEAIYLMDVLGYYQEEAAQSMEVSRPTFARILKQARQKLANGLVGGYRITIEDSKDDLIVALCTHAPDTFELIDPHQPVVQIYHVTRGSARLLNTMDNPVVARKARPSMVLPALLIEHHVNLFIGSRIGEGLRHSLLSRGIQPCVMEHLDGVEALCDLV